MSNTHITHSNYMDHDENRIDHNYVRGFNEGYVLMQYKPRLARSLMAVESESPRMKGFRHGCSQRFLEAHRIGARRRGHVVRAPEQKVKSKKKHGKDEGMGMENQDRRRRTQSGGEDAEL